MSCAVEWGQTMAGTPVTSHRCRQHPGHSGDHRCACGAQMRSASGTDRGAGTVVDVDWGVPELHHTP